MMQCFLVIDQVVVKSTNIVLNYRLLKNTSTLPSTRVMYAQTLFLALCHILEYPGGVKKPEAISGLDLKYGHNIFPSNKPTLI